MKDEDPIFLEYRSWSEIASRMGKLVELVKVSNMRESRATKTYRIMNTLTCGNEQKEV